MQKQAKKGRGFVSYSTPDGFPMEKGESFDLLPGNLFGKRQTGESSPMPCLCPETSLLFAVLDDAIQCFFRYKNGTSRKEQNIYCVTRDWFFNPNPDWLFSFENICEVVGLDPDYIRGGLLRRCARRVGPRREFSVVPVGRSRRSGATQNLGIRTRHDPATMVMRKVG